MMPLRSAKTRVPWRRVDRELYAAGKEDRIRDLRSQTVRLRHLSHSGPRRMLTSMEEHRAMLKAITHGDAQAAESASRHHLAQTLQALIDSLTSGEGAAPGVEIQLDVAR